MLIHDLQNKYLKNDFKLKSEFKASDYSREDVLTRCERYAGWTLPSIFPDDPLMEYDELQNDYQSVGAQAVNNLANKIVMSLFQPAKPFFRMNLTKEQRAALQSTGLSDAEVDAGLSEAEREAMKEFEKDGARIAAFDLALQLIVCGNGLLYTAPDDKHVVYTLRDYVIKRDLRGQMVQLIIRETKAVTSLSNEMQQLAIGAGYREEDQISIYTGIRRVDQNRYVVWQELEDLCYCHNRIGYYTEDTLPWIPQTWYLARGKDYGTGLVEQYSGDFHTLSTLAEAILDYTTVVTDVKNLVDPTGMTDVREISQAQSGAYVAGREEDLFAYTASNEMSAGVAFLEGRFDSVARRIAAAFLLNSQITRDAERVTAEEIRMQAHELESSLGGVYTRLANQLQLPLAKRYIRRLEPVFKDVEPLIVTGFESLSRNSELDNIRAMLTDLANIANVPEAAQEWIKMGDMIAVLGAGHGVNYEKFLETKEGVDAKRKIQARADAQAAGMEAGAVEQATGTQ